MINHAWTIICQKSVIDQDTNNMSLDVLEQLTFQLPILPDEDQGYIIPFNLEVISLWYRNQADPGEKKQGYLTFVAPNGAELMKANIDIDLTTHHRTRSRIRLTSLPIPKDTSGYFQFIIEVESKKQKTKVARVPLEIIINADAPNVE
jgi:hypothetical protein